MDSRTVVRRTFSGGKIYKEVVSKRPVVQVRDLTIKRSESCRALDPKIVETIREFEANAAYNVPGPESKDVRGRGYIVVSFYTNGTGYAHEVQKLKASLDRFKLPWQMFAVKQTGTWRGNLNYKSACILKAFDMFPGKDIIFLDADAIVRKNPVLFDELSAKHNYDLSAHFFKYDPRSGDADELLSGTLWIQNNEIGRAIVRRWHEVGLTNHGVRHQMCLKAAIGDLRKDGIAVRVFRHPFAYTCIFDYFMARRTVPVIEHFQASRRLRRTVGFGEKLLHRRMS